MTIALEGIGLALPEHSISQQDAAVLTAAFNARDDEQRRSMAALFKRTGILKRHSVLLNSPKAQSRQSFYEAPLNGERGPGTACRMAAYEAAIGEIACRSAGQALAVAACEASSITHLITASCSGFSAPGIDCRLIEELGLDREVRRVHVGFMGCHAAVNALAVAQAFCQADSCARVLICCAELCTLHMQYGWERDLLLANALFGDGAASAVLSAGGQGGESQWSVRTTGSFIVPQTEDQIQWRIGDHGFEMRLAPSVPEVLKTQLRPWVAKLLAREDLSLHDIQSWAIHPGGPRIVQAVEEALELRREQTAVSREILAECGNMSSPTLLFILERLMKQNAARPCLALAFGPGLAIEAAILE